VILKQAVPLEDLRREIRGLLRARHPRNGEKGAQRWSSE